MSSVIRVLGRKKHYQSTDITHTELARCLSTLDLATLGIGSTLGVGIYVIAGDVAKNHAGPSVVLSFFIAAVASFFAGLCYAEFGARVPKAGSAYVYSYVTVGEFLAFIIGWNLILEYVIGTASVARGWTSYLDSLCNNVLSNFWRSVMPINVRGLSEYPDFLALAITLLLTVVLTVGAKQSSVINNIFTAVNVFVMAYVIICGAFKAQLHNWNLSEEEVYNATHSHNFGSGGFFPFGFHETIAGASTCFYAFVGFDCIATTGEEVRNPQRAIPLSIIICLGACFLAYVGISGILTLMVPYYDIDTNAPLPEAFDYVGWTYAKYIIGVGAISGLSSSLIGSMFPMPRIIYAMSSDGLLFRFLSKVSARFQTPAIATVIAGCLSGFMAMMFDLKALVGMMSIGTLLAYTLVAVCVLILRYDHQHTDIASSTSTSSSSSITYEMSEIDRLNHVHSDGSLPRRSWLVELFSPSATVPTPTTSLASKIAISILAAFLTALAATGAFLSDEILTHEWWAISLLYVFSVPSLICIIIIIRQPQNKAELTFKVPLMPFLPIISVFVNIYLMLKLSELTWLRFAVWMVIGLTIYFAYGIWHSGERATQVSYQDLDRAQEQEPYSVQNDMNTANYESVSSDKDPLPIN